MSRTELYEWIIIILCIISWWPLIFLGFDPLWYRLFIYIGVPLVLLGILARRFGRVREGLDYSEKVIESQRGTPGMPPGMGMPPGPSAPNEETTPKDSDNS